jgi:pimeloyl-ACP methyl ester carboxylesterase
VAWFPRWASSSLPLLRARLAAEPDLDATATMLVALGLLAGGRGETGDAARLEQLLGDADAVVRWAAAVALARLFPQAPPAPAVTELFGWLTGATTAGRHPMLARTKDRDKATTWATRQAQYDAVCAWGIPNHALLQRLSAIDLPVLVANGDSDPMILPHYSYLLAGLIPQARVKIYPDSAHGFLFQYHAEFAADVEAFLGNPC